MRHHSGQIDHFDHCDDVYLFLIRVQTMLNHIRFDFYHNINVKDNIFSRVQLKKALCDKLM